MMHYAAILWDMDGTLIDSGRCWRRATAHSFDVCGLTISDTDLDRLAAVALTTYLQDRGDEEHLQHVKDVRDEMLLPLLEREVQWLAGAKELLEACTQPTAIVTGSHRKAFDALIRGLKIDEVIDTFVTSDDIAPNFKPKPHGLLLACERLGVDPTQCVYIGDQDVDLEAAAAAGMDAILLRGPYTPGDLTHEKMAGDFAELKMFLS